MPVPLLSLIVKMVKWYERAVVVVKVEQEQNKYLAGLDLFKTLP